MDQKFLLTVSYNSVLSFRRTRTAIISTSDCFTSSEARRRDTDARAARKEFFKSLSESGEREKSIQVYLIKNKTVENLQLNVGKLDPTLDSKPGKY